MTAPDPAIAALAECRRLADESIRADYAGRPHDWIPGNYWGEVVACTKPTVDFLLNQLVGP